MHSTLNHMHCSVQHTVTFSLLSFIFKYCVRFAHVVHFSTQFQTKEEIFTAEGDLHLDQYNITLLRIADRERMVIFFKSEGLYNTQ